MTAPLTALDAVLEHSDHPARKVIGIISGEEPPGMDFARDHDEVLAEAEIASWRDSPRLGEEDR